VVVCLERDADLHMAQLMPLPLTVSCFSRFSRIQIGFTFLVQAHPGSPGKRAVKWVCVLQLHSKQRLEDIMSTQHFLVLFSLFSFWFRAVD